MTEIKTTNSQQQ